jgi:glycine/D-amino acid oxidase-like deaminating enzyme
MTPDRVPVIREVAAGVVAAGHGTLGTTLGPATGRIVAALVGGSAGARAGG